MSRLAAGVTFLLVFLTCAALSVDSLKLGEDCSVCEVFIFDTSRVKSLSDDEKDRYQQCRQRCAHIFSDATGEKRSSDSNNPSVMSQPPTRRFFGMTKHFLQLFSYYMYKLMVLSAGILECAFDNSVLVMEASLDLPVGTFGRPRCDRLDLVALGVPPVYVRLLKSIAKLIAPRRRGEEFSESLFGGLEDEIHDEANSPRVQRKAIQKALMRK